MVEIQAKSKRFDSTVSLSEDLECIMEKYSEGYDVNALYSQAAKSLGTEG